MDEKLVTGLLERLDVLAAKLGVGAEVLWGALLKQAQISGLMSVVWIALVVAVCPFLLRGWKHTFNEINEHGDPLDFAPPIAGMFIATAVCAAIALVCVENALTAFINPEYWAFHEILRTRK